jgi:hypothetical protein
MAADDNIQSCPYNEGVDCATAACERCGWHPLVAAKRLEAITGLKKYKVPFTGFCEVWARSPEEAVDKADNDEMFFLHYNFGDPECLEKEEENELD